MLTGNRRHWKRQPFGQLRLNQADPLTDGLFAGIVGNSRADLVTGLVYSGSQTGEAATELGVGATLNGTSNGLWRAFPAGTVTSQCTVFALVTPSAANQNDKRIFALGLSTTGSGSFAGIGTANTGSLNRLRYSGPTGGDLYSTSDYIAAGQSIAVLFRGGSAGRQFFVNGVLDTATSSSPFETSTTFDRVAWGQIRRNADATHFAGSIAYGLAWNRYLSDAEVEALFQNPWRAVRGRRIWVPVSAGGPSLSLSASPLALSGTLSTTGDLTITPAATLALSASPLAIAGTLATAGELDYLLPTLALSASPLSITGTLAPTGDLAYELPTLALSASPLALSGTLTPSGDIDYQLPFALTASALAVSGAVSVSGDLSITDEIKLTLSASPLALAGALAVAGDLDYVVPTLVLSASPLALSGTVAVTGDPAAVVPFVLTASPISLTGAVDVTGEISSSDVVSTPVAPAARIWVPPTELRVLTGLRESRTLKATP